MWKSTSIIFFLETPAEMKFYQEFVHIQSVGSIPTYFTSKSKLESPKGHVGPTEKTASWLFKNYIQTELVPLSHKLAGPI